MQTTCVGNDRCAWGRGKKNQRMQWECNRDVVARSREGVRSPIARLGGAFSGFALGALLLTGSVHAGAAADSRAADAGRPSAREIMERVARRPLGEHASRRLTLEVTSEAGSVGTIRMESYRTQDENGTKTVFFPTAPRVLAGGGFLVHRPRNGATRQWLYIAGFDFLRLLDGHYRRTNLFGSDFTYEDLREGPSINDYTFRFLRSERRGEDDCYVVEGVPRSKALVEDLGYGRIVGWITKSHWGLVRADYFDQFDKPLKSLEITSSEVTGGIWTPREMVIKHAQIPRKSKLTYDRVDYEAPFPRELLTRDGFVAEAKRRYERLVSEAAERRLGGEAGGAR